MKRVFVVLMLVLAVVMLSSAVLAQVEQEIEREAEDREVSIETDAESVEIESKQENGSAGTENAFEVEFEADEQVEIKLTFKEGREVNGSEQEQEMSYAVETEALIEFEDANGNGVYDDGEEVSRYSLEDADFEPINYHTQETVNGVTEHVITAQSTDGVFTITLHVVGSFAQIGSTTVDPTEVKIDLAMEDYAFESADSDLALLAKLKTERETEQDGVEREEGVSIRSADVTGFFTWQPTATVDGATKQVNADIRPRDERGEQGIVLAYPQGDSIVHDPRVGFRIAEPGGGVLIPVAVALALAIFAVLAVRRYY